MSFGENIKRRREELKLSQEFAADMPGVSLHAGFLHAAATALFGLPDHRGDRAYAVMTAADILLLAACCVWMASNHRFEADKSRRLKNIRVELACLALQTLIGVFDMRLGMGLFGVALILAVMLVYLIIHAPQAHKIADNTASPQKARGLFILSKNSSKIFFRRHVLPPEKLSLTPRVPTIK